MLLNRERRELRAIRRQNFQSKLRELAEEVLYGDLSKAIEFRKTLLSAPPELAATVAGLTNTVIDGKENKVIESDIRIVSCLSPDVVEVHVDGQSVATIRWMNSRYEVWFAALDGAAIVRQDVIAKIDEWIKGR